MYSGYVLCWEQLCFSCPIPLVDLQWQLIEYNSKLYFQSTIRGFFSIFVWLRIIKFEEEKKNIGCVKSWKCFSKLCSSILCHLHKIWLLTTKWTWQFPFWQLTHLGPSGENKNGPASLFKAQWVKIPFERTTLFRWEKMTILWY